MRSPDEEFDALITTLYGVALSPHGWSDAMAALQASFQACNAHLMVWDPGLPHPLFSHALGMSERMQADYQAHYGALDPRRQHVARMDEGAWLACHHQFDSRAVSRSEFYQDYLIPGGIRYLLGTRLTRREGLDVFFGMHRAPGEHAFDDPELALAQRLTPHFQTAAQLWLATQTLRQQAAIGMHALDALEYGVLAADRLGRLSYANQPAQAMLQSGWPLRLRLGKLCPPRGDATASQFLPALQACATTHQPRWLRFGQADHATQPLCTLTVLNTATERSPPTVAAGAELLLLITHSRHRRTATVEQLMALFGLTPAEARLARALATGESLEAYVQAVALAMPTARTQLRAVFRKLGIKRQSELTRLLAVLPGSRGRG